MNYIIITSINSITAAIEEFSAIPNWKVVVVADKKSKPYEHKNVEFLTIEKQESLGFQINKTLPYNHYSRKNIGYLYAIQQGANNIYDTDDDTIPYNNWQFKNFTCSNLVSGNKYINPFSFFSDKKVWPRGFHLSEINKRVEYEKTNIDSEIGVWQGVIDGDSDFDAIYRLTIDEHVKFNVRDDIAIQQGCYSPFNTQSTLWNNKLYELLYIPISVDFRFTDILRGYIAQRIMWDYGYKLGFHSPNTYQVRNAHDYYKDFLGEISMYENVPKVIKILDTVKLTNKSIGDDMMCVYANLLEQKIITSKEVDNLLNWLKDIKN